MTPTDDDRVMTSDQEGDESKESNPFLGILGRSALVAPLLLGFLALRRGRAALEGARANLGILRPPGSLDEPGFLATCIRCTRCADACEPQCIRCFGPEAGSLQGTPYILPGDKACNLCLACGKTCPVEAIKPLDKMEQAEMGLAVVDKRLCVSLNGTGICGACHTVCPLRNRAITLDIRNAPTVVEDECVGCGLCEEVCIVRQPRAIYVQTSRHRRGVKEAVGA